MKIAILGDLHIGAKNSAEVMFTHQAKFFKFFINELKARKIDTIFQLGDLFDSRKAINLRSLDFVKTELFEPLKKEGIEFHTLIGNHDIFYRERLDIHSTGLLLNEYDNVHIYDKPTTLERGGLTWDFIPWMAKANETECLEYIDNSLSDICLGHFEINSFEVVKNNIYYGGLDTSRFGHYKQVFSGHFHIQNSARNILYVGTPYALTWGDANLKKGFFIYDTDTKTFEFIENTHTYYWYLVYDDVKKNFTDLKAIDLENAFVKLIIRSKTEPFLYEQYINHLYSLKPFDVKFIENDDLVLTESSENSDMEITDTVELMKNFIDSTDNPNKEALKAFMVGIYHEATNS